jgi:hypothetical protein
MYLARRWKRQPQGPVEVDWGHPMARGLGAVYLGSLHRFIAASGTATALAPSSWSVSSRGRSPSISSTAAYAYAPTSVPASGWTVAAIIAPSSAENNARYIGHASAPGGSVDDRQIGTSASGAWRSYLYDTSVPDSRFANSTVSASAGRADVVIAWYDPVAGTLNCAANAPGSVGSVSVGSGGVAGYGSTPTFCVGNASVLSHGALCVPIALKADRTWTPGERAAWFDNPWQLLRPARPIIYSLPSSLVSAINESEASRTEYASALAAGAVFEFDGDPIPQPQSGTSIFIDYDAGMFGGASVKVEIIDPQGS